MLSKRMLDDADLGHGRRSNPELEAYLERARAQREERESAARRTRLHSFGLAGGRRS